MKARCGPVIWPVGRFTFQFLQRRFHFIDAHLVRGHRVRIHLHVDGVFLLAQHLHLRHAADIEMRWATRVSAYSSRVHSGSSFDVSAR